MCFSDFYAAYVVSGLSRKHVVFVVFRFQVALGK